MKKKQQKQTTLVKQISILNVFSVAVLGLFLLVSMGIIIKMRIETDYQSIARTAATHMVAMYEQMDDGEYSYDEATGTVYKGQTEITDEAFWYINNDNANMHHTFFWGTTRVMSDLTDSDGNSVVGTQLTDQTIISTVANQGYYTENNVEIYGKKYSVCYFPLKNGDNIVGYMFVGVNQTSANAGLRTNILVSALITLIIIALVTLVVRIRISKFTKQFNNNLGNASTIADEKKNNVVSIGETTNETMEQINTAIDQVSEAVTSQASYTEEIMGTMEEFGSSIDVIMNHVENTSDAANQSIETINKLKKQLNELTSVVSDNSENILAISKEIEEDNEAVSDISKIIDVINDIAFQITILSFNASVEAARAGEAGKGFAVVADSIKDLSDKTKESLADITKIVQDVDNKMVSTSDSSKELIERNNKVTEELAATREKLDEVVNSYNTIIENINKVIDESGTIVESKNQVVETVSSLAATSEENAAMSQEMKASSDMVLENTKNLMGEIQKLEEITGIISGIQKDFG